MAPRKKWIVAAAVLLLLLACKGASPEERAAQAACSYYGHLVDDRPADFLAGKAGADTLQADYRSQLLAAIAHFRDDMVRKHGGLRAVSVSPAVARRDTSLHVTYAFLLLSFADSTQEEVTVPMVETASGRWLMK